MSLLTVGGESMIINIFKHNDNGSILNQRRGSHILSNSLATLWTKLQSYSLYYA